MPDDKEAVLDALRAINDAFGKRDLAAFERVCEPDVVWIGSTEGEEVVGRGESITTMWEAIAGRSEGVRFKLDWESVDVEVRGESALLTAFGEATFQTRYRTSISRFRLTGVLQRSAGRWRWRVYHASEPLPW
jgi:uncharacterized protein (TIGR02246 family)